MEALTLGLAMHRQPRAVEISNLKSHFLPARHVLIFLFFAYPGGSFFAAVALLVETPNQIPALSTVRGEGRILAYLGAGGSLLSWFATTSKRFGHCLSQAVMAMSRAFPALPMLLLAAAYAMVATADADAPADDAISYSLYPSYPRYCSTPEEMATRAIPPLSSSAPEHSQLVHVTAVIRHGARTPWSDNMQCWDGYWADPATAVWNCELTTLTSPPSPPFIADVEDDPAPSEIDNERDAAVGDDAMFLFEKRYDALHDPPVLANAFNGTCQMGQLLLRGYEQELANGKHLRDAYVYAAGPNGDAMFKDGSGAAASDPRMRLFDLNADGGADYAPYEEPHLYYRADDEQRTLMSGQVLLRGLFGPEIATDAKRRGVDPVIVLHTADYKVSRTRCGLAVLFVSNLIIPLSSRGICFICPLNLVRRAGIELGGLSPSGGLGERCHLVRRLPEIQHQCRGAGAVLHRRQAGQGFR